MMTPMIPAPNGGVPAAIGQSGRSSLVCGDESNVSVFAN